MSDASNHSIERARHAYDALAAAETYAAAKDAWEDFLIHWHRGINRCDALRPRNGAHGRSYDRVTADPALAYLRAARNADEHGLAPVATLQESAIAIGAFGGYEPGIRTGASGEVIYTFTPTSDDPPPFIAFVPEHLRLDAIVDRAGTFPVPPEYDYEVGEILPAVALAQHGLDFLMSEVKNLSG
ncbi:hypothetical protein [Brevundimonas variabilis]|uniref:Uncharacterized protein n=1 Tax=Brevundimonas variabilis TaxID=74312 RepID=A0A7W9CIZ7_9CAUL|nr:hypothetical protein [Brevundimonas variabilis]MBB5746565.1 hypothetical protein [Brevundimonas variabilis]